MNKKLDRAVAFHREGQLLKAESLYLEILENDKKKFSSITIIGDSVFTKK